MVTIATNVLEMEALLRQCGAQGLAGKGRQYTQVSYTFPGVGAFGPSLKLWTFREGQHLLETIRNDGCWRLYLLDSSYQVELTEKPEGGKSLNIEPPFDLSSRSPIADNTITENEIREKLTR